MSHQAGDLYREISDASPRRGRGLIVAACRLHQVTDRFQTPPDLHQRIVHVPQRFGHEAEGRRRGRAARGEKQQRRNGQQTCVHRAT
ncbi:MAG: hypothetical protein CMJ83_21215 [Planctomycetes bacterium]|nr:hypothetical protein [Planctomycetota bacterium]